MYKAGQCPLCDTQIQVRGFDGRWNSNKTNYAQADLVFEDGHRCRTMICKDCLKAPDIQKLFEIIVHPNSEASSRATLEALKKHGKPIKIQEATGGN